MRLSTPLVKTVEVACEVDHAFEIFTAGIDGWWPVAGHSLAEDKVERIVFERELGGRILERWHDGTECAWGEIKVWEPPRRVAFTWLPNPDTGRGTEVEITFRPGPRSTIVTLEHRGWEEDESGRRDGYDGGWERVLALYAEAAAS